MKRRTFIQSAMSLATLGSGALWARAAHAQQTVWDYIIVGAGTAGLPAAIFASRRGARVLLIDPADDVGGTLHLANGQVSAAGTRLQDAKGIADSTDSHYEDIMAMSRGLADPDVIRTTVDHAPRTINWLLDNGLTPLPDMPVTGEVPGRMGYSVPRYLWAREEGRAILAVVRAELAPELASGRVVTQLNTRVTGLITNDAGGVHGVRARSGDEDFTFRGRHVLITSGGYAMNPDLFEMLVGHPAYASGSYPHSLGDGLGLATSVGGWLRGQDKHRAGTGSILTADRFPARVYARFNTVPQERQPWEIWVNAEGRRFIREDEPGVYARTQALVHQPRLRYAIVFDEAIFSAAPLGIKDWSRSKMLEHFESHPMFARANSLSELAEKARVDPRGMAETVANYNAGVARRSDDLGRTHLPLPIVKPPFYAITHLGSSATSSAGIVVDRELRVLRGDGEPIPNLYAAGEVLGSGATLGAAFAPGMMLTPALTLGRLLGERLPLGSQTRMG
jgi:fumarate reductase flavoprotein subunit